MSAPTAAPQRQIPPSFCEKTCGFLIEKSAQAGAGAFVGWAFSIVNPIAGAIVGLSTGLADTLGEKLATEFTDHALLHVAIRIASLINGAALGAFIAATCGFPVTALIATALALATLITPYVLDMLLPVAGAGFACAGGASLALCDCFC